MPSNKRPSFVNFPIPFDHPYTIPTLIATVGASAWLYYSLQASHKADLKEAIRLQLIHKRRKANRKEDKFASFKIEKQFINPFKEWKQDNSSRNKGIECINMLMGWLGIGSSNDLTESKNNTLSVVKPNLDLIRANDKTTFTWFGQSTCLFTVDGLRILTDPVFENQDRLMPAPCSIDDIKGLIDIVLVSHYHFDHLDEQIVTVLGNTVTWYIPLGLREWFVKKGVDNVVELDWWQEIHHKGRPDILIASVPAMHSSSSSRFTKDESLWCSFVIKSKSDTLFFCGDTGYVPELFQSIRDLYSPFTLAAIPIGNYQPTNTLYMSPEQAVKAHTDLGAPRLSIGIHWGTFPSSNSNEEQQLQDSFDADSQFIKIDFGETIQA